MRAKIYKIRFLCAIFLLALVINAYINVFFSCETQNIFKLQDLKHDYLYESEALEMEQLQEVISMEEYLRFYKLDAKVHHTCPNVRRPEPREISWKKGVYQHVRMNLNDHSESDVYSLAFYYDDRFLQLTSQGHIRTIVTILVPGPYIRSQVIESWNVLLWYQGYKDPVGVGCKLQYAEGLIRNCSNQFYFQEIVTCILPEISLLPESASLVRKKCGKPTTNMEVVMPYPLRNPREIGVCMASFYGNLSAENVPYFVNWMETLKILGASEVSINNATLHFMDELPQKMFDYYQGVKRLTFTHYPPVHDKWNSAREEDAATEAINKIATGDCIYRNMKRYWYTLIIDMDEIPVPRHHTTYQDFISDYTRKYPNTTSVDCLAVRSTFFYLTQTPGNYEYPLHLPVLRQTLRFRTEPMEVDGVGLSKSFHNTRTMVSAGHHLTRGTHNYVENVVVSHHYTTEEDILIHHYRKRCKYEKFCRENWTDTIHDDILPRKFGSRITHQVEHVLNAIGYNTGN